MSDIKDFCTFCDPNTEDKNKIYYKTKNFTVWLSVGQIVEGYSLIIPNDHYNCIGALPAELQEEYLSLKSLIRKKLLKFMETVFFMNMVGQVIAMFNLVKNYATMHICMLYL